MAAGHVSENALTYLIPIVLFSFLQPPSTLSFILLSITPYFRSFYLPFPHNRQYKITYQRSCANIIWRRAKKDNKKQQQQQQQKQTKQNKHGRNVGLV